MFGKAYVAIALGLRQYLRNGLFMVLLVVLPPAFITLSFLVTPEASLVVDVPEGGRSAATGVGMVKLHGAVMVPMTTAFLSGILGLFVMLSSREADRRLVASGYPLALLLTVRLALIMVFCLLITVLAVGFTLIDFRPPQPGLFFLINLVAALHYAFIGAIAGTFLSAMSGTYLVFFLPMIDLGLVQNPMFPRDTIAWWAKLLPGYTPIDVLVDVSFSSAFDTGAELAVALGYLVALGLVVTLLFRRVTTAAGGGRAGATAAGAA